ncbi:MAG: choice-of-anchor L domain-containing protein [Caulobacteraceae bacterium]|nr:choice-of-anchor L domain-containing protein [Caulobacteraceae bacterium]
MQSENVLAETQIAVVETPAPQALSTAATQLPAEPITVADQGQPGAIVNAIMGSTPGLTVDANSIVITGGATSVGYYDGSLSGLGIGAGLLITSGTMPGYSNTVGWFGQDNGLNGDPALDAVINPIFQTTSYDATTITFDFTVTDPTITGISFNIVFGTDEYPEWVDQFVDIAVILVNGVNVAYFGNDPNAPLSVISQNLAAGYFIDNSNSNLPIEYDGVSNVLTVFAPVHQGVNTITIGIADTGDHIYDSGLFISGLTGTTIPGSGVSQDVPCTEGNDDKTGGDASDSINGLGGDDHLSGGGGNDIIQGGTGADILDGGTGNDSLDGGDGADSISAGAGDDLIKFSGMDAIDGGDGQDEVIFDLSASQDGETLDFSNPSAVQTLVDGSTVVNVETIVFTGGLGADVITGGANADLIAGGGGDDVLAGGGGGDTLDGGDGFDTAVFTGAAADYLITTGAGGELIVEDLRPGSPDGITTLINIEQVQFADGLQDPAPLVSHGETILGTSDDDVISGSQTVPGQGFATDFADIITAGDGDDIVYGLGGDDTIDLGANNDIADGGDGDDSITGGDGDDEIDGGAGVDIAVFSGNRADYLVVEQGDGYLITDLRGGSPDGQDQLVNVEFAQFADGLVKLTIGSAPEIGVGDTVAEVIEPEAASGLTSVNGSFEFSDADHDDTHTVSVVGVSGDQTGVTFQATLDHDTDGENPGAVSWTVQVDTAVIQSLAQGQVRTILYTVAVTDSAGNETDQVVAVEIIGTNDAPIVNATAAIGVPSDGGPVTVSAMTGVSDGDLGGKPHVGSVGDLPAGVVFDPVTQTFTVDPLDAALVTQTGGSDSVIVVNYTITDGFTSTPASLTFNVAGSGVDIIGTAGNDMIDGVQAPAGQPHASGGADVINGRAGDDTLFGLNGDDYLIGESGTDTLWGGNGADTLDGGSRIDYLHGGSGDDVFVVRGLEALQDVFDGGSTGETLGDAIQVDGVGDVTIQGFNATASGIERWVGNGAGLLGRAGSETFDLSGLDAITGLAWVDADGGNDTLIGSQFDDDLRGGTGNDSLDGGLGADHLTGGAGNDIFHVDDAGDVVTELDGEGTDKVFTRVDFSLAGTAVENLAAVGALGLQLTGNVLNNIITGGAGGDRLDGGAGNDTLDGGDGDDTLIGGLGSDIITGGAGLDTVDYSGAASAVSVSLNTASNQNTLGGGIDRISGVENVTGSAFDDTLTGSSAANVLDGGAGADVLNGREGADTLRGGDGDDRMIGGAGADAFDGGAGTDMVDYRTASGSVSLNLETGVHTGEALGDTFVSVERFLLSNGNDSFIGTAAGDIVDGYDGNDTLSGAGGADNLRGLNGNDLLDGGDGNDSLQGGSGSDTLLGGAGIDKLYGEAGSDTLTGGTGADQFIWSVNANLGVDHITDFENGVDHIRLIGTGATQFSDLTVTTNGSGWAVITLANGSQIVLDGVVASAVDASDFLWG